MAGPYPPHQGTDPSGPYPVPPTYGPNYGGSADGAYPTPLPPPVPFPKAPRWPLLVAGLVTVAAVAGIVVALVFAGGEKSTSTTTGPAITAESAQEAIQTYLDALSNKDLEVIARNTLCGIYEGVKDRRSDDALAKMSSDAFEKQFSEAEVTSVDAIVYASPNAAQVLFTMRTEPARGTRGGPAERQGVAQLLSYDNQILVCSYVLRTAGAF
ncbi:hypothetical protein [[Mycobacterium] burgundiense]|uniref:DUF8174 domain-containing protein n=1 Tax=[Mycobacterium] burgundiense TaxID=3064286 RepID=A0ABM9LNC4_9MYCO|nr:hypothetical protein [Mycolicibacterium sp. MU0053]CAJ1501930.1 hypothetical protein MU0053_002053 [Mycolicibacterium sp. MU0053]